MAAQHVVRYITLPLNVALHFTGIINLDSRTGLNVRVNMKARISIEDLPYTICIDPHKNLVKSQSEYFLHCIVHEKLRFMMMKDEVRCYETKQHRKNKIVESQSFIPHSKCLSLPLLWWRQSVISYISETKHLHLIFVQLDELYYPSNMKYYKELKLGTMISSTGTIMKLLKKKK